MLVSLLQEVEAGAKSGQIRLQTDLGPGSVWFAAGRVIDAEVATATGYAAIFRLLAMNGAGVEIEYKPVDRVATIHGSLQDLLEARAHRAEEWRRLVDLVPALDTVPAINRARLDARRAELSDVEFKLLGLVDRRRTILDVIDDSGLDAVAALERIAAHFRAGILTVALPGRSGFPSYSDE